jgi:LmbE family N-acetylglucosaminyl deacetylase
VKTYLVVAAHPDDPDFGVAGTAAQLVRDGHRVDYLVLTSGDAGSEDPAQSPLELMEIREAEQRAAGGILGLTEVTFLRYPDGELEPTLALRKALVREMRRVRADVVLCQDPRLLISDEGTYLNHPDHRAAGQAAVDAAFPGAGNPAAYRDLLAEGFAPHKVREVWLYFARAAEVNHWVDISATMDLKIAALAAHASQLGEWATSGALAKEMRQWGAAAAARAEQGWTYAEGFQRVVLYAHEDEPTEAAAVEVQAQGGGRVVPSPSAA